MVYLVLQTPEMQPMVQVITNELFTVVLSFPRCCDIQTLNIIFLDSAETAEKEIKHFFPEFDQGYWFRHDARRFQTGQVVFDDSQGIHTVNEDR